MVYSFEYVFAEFADVFFSRRMLLPAWVELALPLFAFAKVG